MGFRGEALAAYNKLAGRDLERASGRQRGGAPPDAPIAIRRSRAKPA